MSEAAILRQKISDLSKDNARLHQEKMQLLDVLAQLHNERGAEREAAEAERDEARRALALARGLPE